MHTEYVKVNDGAAHLLRLHHPPHLFQHADHLSTTLASKPSRITVPSPILSPPPSLTVASLTCSSDSTTSMANSANELPSRLPLQPPPHFLEGKSEKKAELGLPSGMHVQGDQHYITNTASRADTHSPSSISAWSNMKLKLPEEYINNGAALHHVDDEGRHPTASMGSLAAVEHYHIIELEEQLHYWRKRALFVEDQALQTQRALQARWETFYAAVRTSSESLTRELLLELHRLHEQLDTQRGNVKQSPIAEQGKRSSSESYNTTSTTRCSSTADSSCLHAQEEQQLHGDNGRYVGGLQDQQYPPQLFGETRPRDGEESKDTKGSAGPTVTLLHAVRHGGSPCLSCTTNRGHQIVSTEPPHADGSNIPHHNVSPATHQADFLDLCRDVLLCVMRCSELRSFHAVLCKKSCDRTHTTTDSDAEAQHSARVARGLRNTIKDRSVSDATSSFDLAQHLPLLRRSLEHVSATLLACVNDMALLSSRLEPNYAVTSAPPSPLLRDAHRGVDPEEPHRSHATHVQEQKLRDIVATVRQASTAEHHGAPRAQRDVPWWKQLSDLTDEGNNCINQDAVLRNRWNLPQQSRSTVAAQTASANARPSVTGISQYNPLLRNSSWTAPRVTCGDTPLNRRTAGIPSKSFSVPLSMPPSPSRSLTYSSPPSIGKGQRHVWGEGAKNLACARDTSVLPCPPMDVWQPSVLATPEINPYAGVDPLTDLGRLGNEVREQEDVMITRDAPPSLQPQPTTSTPTSCRQQGTTETGAVVVSTPLKSMRAWEHKFRSILPHM